MGAFLLRFLFIFHRPFAGLLTKHLYRTRIWCQCIILSVLRLIVDELKNRRFNCVAHEAAEVLTQNAIRKVNIRL